MCHTWILASETGGSWTTDVWPVADCILDTLETQLLDWNSYQLYPDLFCRTWSQSCRFEDGKFHSKETYDLHCLVGGLEHFLFLHLLGIIIPIDVHIFQRGGPTTNQMIYIVLLSYLCSLICRVGPCLTRLLRLTMVYCVVIASQCFDAAPTVWFWWLNDVTGHVATAPLKNQIMIKFTCLVVRLQCVMIKSQPLVFQFQAKSYFWVLWCFNSTFATISKHNSTVWCFNSNGSMRTGCTWPPPFCSVDSAVSTKFQLCTPGI